MPATSPDFLRGRLLVVAPHMDDELLACGGLMALRPNKQEVFVVYATDGMKSPAPVLPQDQITPDLGEVRVKESQAAMAILGVGPENLHFLRLPEAELSSHIKPLRRRLLAQIDALRPDFIFIPFRFDRHPDHLAINHVVSEAYEQGRIGGALVEYFVYYRWRLLRGGDVRQYIRPSLLVEVDTQAVAARQRLALDAFRSQTTIYYPWQTRPILRPQLLDETCETPELFLRYDRAHRGGRVFSRAVPWIRFVHRVEPRLQKWKYLSASSLRRGLGRK
jgi:LmbE family N-acetylglucosaminyl deacetylase